MIEDETGFWKKEVTTPFTNYMITVLESIKGELGTNYSLLFSVLLNEGVDAERVMSPILSADQK